MEVFLTEYQFNFRYNPMQNIMLNQPYSMYDFGSWILILLDTSIDPSEVMIYTSLYSFLQQRGHLQILS